MKEVLNLSYASSLTSLREINSSFDVGVLRIAYAGKNRNGSFISKDAFEKSIRSMYNCPIVCHYDRETDSLGGHDVEVVQDADGNYRLVNLTVPVGVIPESAKYWWDYVTEDDGTVHEYLYTEVLLWKRQEAYRKIKQDGIVEHSMEISVLKGKVVDGIYQIDEFEFTAFALIGVTPCFESAALELFSAHDKQEFKQQLSEMMQEIKECFSLFGTPTGDNDRFEKDLEEGGDKELDNNIELQVLDDVQETFSENAEGTDENTSVFEEVTNEEEAAPVETVEDDQQEYALLSNVVDELRRSLDAVTVSNEYGEWARYWYVDCDTDAKEVYCWDSTDWLLYGFSYTLDGDAATIDFDSKKRKKYVIADFEGGEQPSPFFQAFEMVTAKLRDASADAEKYQSAVDAISNLEAELNDLRKFKSDVDTAVAEQERETVFEKFTDLFGNEAFEELRSHGMDYDVPTLEEKCYAIRGRYGNVAKFAFDAKAPKLMVDKDSAAKELNDEPYGGMFVKYGKN